MSRAVPKQLHIRTDIWSLWRSGYLVPQSVVIQHNTSSLEKVTTWGTTVTPLPFAIFPVCLGAACFILSEANSIVMLASLCSFCVMSI